MKKIFSLNNPLSITLVCLILGLGWILLSDRLTHSLFSDDILKLSRFQLYKGIFYVVITSLILFLMIRSLYDKVNQRNQELELLFSNPDLGLFKVTEQGIILEVSKNIEKITGYRSDELIGRHPVKFIPKDLQAANNSNKSRK